jgi:hypothetical protein
MMGGAARANAQSQCDATRTQLTQLLNSLRVLEGLPPIQTTGAHSVKPSQPLQPIDTSGSSNSAYNASAVQQWHTAHDAEIKQLETTLDNPPCGTPSAPQPTPEHPYDLVFSSVDDTGFASSPVWNSTIQAPWFANPDPHDCGNLNPWWPQCTTQTPELNTDSGLCPTGNLGGHANWIAVSYTGRLTWESHSLESQDDDYNFGLLPVIPQAQIPWITSSDDPLAGLHLEFSSDETIDHFSTSWWQRFHDAVDSDDRNSTDSPFGPERRVPNPGYVSKALALVHGNFAIVKGLMGLDCAHSCGAEIHPVWAIAIHTQDSPTDDVWAFFVRNWGNEGYCSSKQELVNTQSIIFRLPWRSNSTSVAVTSVEAKGKKGTAENADFITWNPQPQQAVLIEFTIAPPDKHDWSELVLHFNWGANSARSFLGPILSTVSNPAIHESDDENEAQAAAAFAKLSPAQQSLTRRNLQRVTVPASISGPVKFSLAKAPPRASAVPLRTTTALDAAGTALKHQQVAAIKAAASQ